MNRMLLATAAVTASLASTTAVAQSFLPTHLVACDGNRVKKEELAGILLDLHRVSRRLETELARRHPAESPVRIQQQLLTDETVCQQMTCTSGEQDALRAASQSMNSLLLEAVGYANPDGVLEPAIYFEGPAELTCTTQEGVAERDAFAYTLPFRVRGSVDSLHVARKDPSLSSFAAAAVSLSEDNVKDKTTQQVSLILARPFNVSRWLPFDSELAPYVGFTRDLSRVADQAASVTADTHQFGVSLEMLIGRPRTDFAASGHRLTVRPDILVNDDDSSQVASVSAAWMPVINGRLNSYRQVRSNDPDFLSWRPIFDVRAVHGVFTDRGLRTEETSRDFTRLGGQVGLTVKSDNPRWPLTVTLTDTWLASLNSGEDLELTEGRFSWSLDPEKVFTIDLTWSDGRRSDLDPDRDGWKLTLGARY